MDVLHGISFMIFHVRALLEIPGDARGASRKKRAVNSDVVSVSVAATGESILRALTHLQHSTHERFAY